MKEGDKTKLDMRFSAWLVNFSYKMGSLSIYLICLISFLTNLHLPAHALDFIIVAIVDELHVEPHLASLSDQSSDARPLTAFYSINRLSTITYFELSLLYGWRPENSNQVFLILFHFCHRMMGDSMRQQ